MSLNRNFVCVDYLFRGKENRIICYVDSTNTLKLEIEEKASNLEWIASFTSEYIEELTKKTGNFKSYDIFIAMLQTVLTQNSDSLSLDLMSYSDLEELRKLKMGSLGLGKITPTLNTDTSRQNKRYLILTYTTDFDKVHYPLPLTFQGVPDVKNLKDTILTLRRQIIGSNQGGMDYDKFEISELNKRISQLKTENEQLMSSVNKYKNNFQSSESNEDLRKELKAVKSIVRSLEEELSEERSKHQRVLMRKNRENKTLIDEVAELKASKRNLNFRLHSLTNELAIYKRQRNKNGFTSPRPPVCPSPKSSFDLLVASSKKLSKKTKYHHDTSPQMFSDPETTRISHVSRRTFPTDRVTTGLRRCSSADRYRTSSPNSLKFNPTAYIEQQRLKRKEIQEKRQRELRSRLSSGNFSDHSRDSSPASFRTANQHVTNNNRFNVVSSSNASSMSNLDETLLNKSSINKRDFKFLSGKKARPTALNNYTDDEISDSESTNKFRHGLTNQNLQNGFKSDDSSINGRGDSESMKNKNVKTFRRQLLDSEDEVSNHSSRPTKPGFRKEYLVKNSRSKTTKLQQNNNSRLSHNKQSDDINDIDRRLNALQSFFEKYLHE